ncbi:MAG: DUF4426 domain-containing protein [Gammaproteobacteria bacterium]
MSCATAFAETAKRFGAYEVHYSAFHSVDIAADAARAHQLQRAPNIGMLNIAVLQHHTDGTATPVPATITIESTNLVGQIKNLEAKSIEEPGAQYYIASFRFANEETFRFHLTVSPDNAPDQHTEIHFTHTFYQTEP